MRFESMFQSLISPQLINMKFNLVVFATFFLFTGTLSRILDDCNCNPDGSMTNSTNGCDANGQCHCKCGIGGLKCDECLDFHFGFPNCENNNNNISSTKKVAKL